MYFSLSESTFIDVVGYARIDGTPHHGDPRRYEALRLANSERSPRQLTERQEALLRRVTCLADYEALLAIASGAVSFADIARATGEHRSSVKRRYDLRLKAIKREITQHGTIGREGCDALDP